MRYLSVCSGIEAATVAWHGLGWTPAAFSEIEPFPSAVLAHHYPSVPNVGDMTNYKEWNIGAIDLLVGGTPCQSFSVAGLRKGLEDPRGNLALIYCGILDRFRPKWCVWENVPGVLSSNGGRDFGSFLGALAELGYGFAYRVLDAQYFGVAQRRRRVFVVGHLGDWRAAAQVLFEPESLRRDSAPSREKGQDSAASTIPSVANCLTRRMHKGINTTVDEGQTPIPVNVPDVMCTLRATGAGFDRPGNAATEHETYISIKIKQSMAVRRLTPVECERLQGFPDNYTEIPWRGNTETPDGPRYKALGNSMAVPVMQWIGGRINEKR